MQAVNEHKASLCCVERTPTWRCRSRTSVHARHSTILASGPDSIADDEARRRAYWDAYGKIFFVSTSLDGLSIGSVYALIALGLVVVSRGTGHINSPG